MMTTDDAGTKQDQALFESLVLCLEEKAGLRIVGDATACLEGGFDVENCSAPSADNAQETAPRGRSSVEALMQRLGASTRQNKKKNKRCTSIDYGQGVKTRTQKSSETGAGDCDTKQGALIPQSMMVDDTVLVTPEQKSDGDANSDVEPKRVECRVQASSCFQGRAWSFTIRREASGSMEGIQTLGEWFRDHKINELTGGYRPPSLHLFEEGNPTLASIQEICESLMELLHLEIRGDVHPSGLLLVTGGTDCGKSLITRGLIYEYITGGKLPDDSSGGKDLLASKRNRHLVTYEDPIEKWFFPLDAYIKNKESLKNRRIDYTPREKGKDCDGLKECTRAALRQTPTVFYAGELREPEDIAEALYFGGTGHLVVATAHAGNLIEAADKILTSAKATNAQERAIHVPKILGIVHLRRMDASFDVVPINTAPKQKSGSGTQIETDQSITLQTSLFVPSLYRRCPSGMQSFIADGLAALIPHCPTGIGDPNRSYGSLGRQYLVRHILRRDTNQPQKKKGLDFPSLEWVGHWPEILRFHSGLRRSTDSGIRLPPTQGEISPTRLPLWVQCVQDDLRRD